MCKQENGLTTQRFIRKNLFWYIIPNVFFNTCIPYFSFVHLHSVQLFKGEQNLARFLLPMSTLLPFMITFDILKKTIKLCDQGELNVTLKEDFAQNKFIFKLATANGICTGLLALTFMLIAYLLLPTDYNFNGTMLAIFTGFLAGIYSVLFSYLPVKILNIKNAFLEKV